MKIYFAGSIRAGRDDLPIYIELIQHLQQYGEVLTEHIGQASLTAMGENDTSDQFIHDRDMEWLLSADILIAEVTHPSLGVGYEIGRALEHDIQVICLYRPQDGKRLSAMIKGCNFIQNEVYETVGEAKLIMDRLLKAV